MYVRNILLVATLCTFTEMVQLSLLFRKSVQLIVVIIISKQ